MTRLVVSTKYHSMWKINGLLYYIYVYVYMYIYIWLNGTSCLRKTRYDENCIMSGQAC